MMNEGSNMKKTPTIRPVSDLRNNFTEISNLVHETEGPVYLTKNGHEDMVIMSHEAYELEQLKNEIDLKLREAEIYDELHPETFTWEEVHAELKQIIEESKKNND